VVDKKEKNYPENEAPTGFSVKIPLEGEINIS